MKKCDFCTESSPGGHCLREDAINKYRYCEDAIKKMSNVICKIRRGGRRK